MARVPLQTAPSAQLEVGSETQFSGGPGVEPQRDVVSDDIKNFGKAQQAFGKVINQLDDELNDAEAKRLSNEYHADVTAIKNDYGTLKGVNAVGTVEVNGKQVPVYDHYNNKLKTTLESYQAKASNGVVKYIFENKASVYTRSAQNSMTTHSLIEQRNYNIEETEKIVERTLITAGDGYKSWLDPSGAFNIARLEGLAAIDELAKLNGWNIDPNAEDADGNKIGISEQYLAEVNKFKIGLAESVIDKFTEDGNQKGIRDFLAAVKAGALDEKTYKKIEAKAEAKSEENNGDKKVNAVLVNNSNQNDGNTLTQATLLSGLSSSQSFDDGTGAAVTDGLHSDKFDTSNTKQTENIEILSKLKSTSKFYQPESNVRLIPQHQTTHLFAIQVLDVKRADSLYTKAKRSIKIDPQRFADDPDYAKEMNAKILDKYNELIVGATSRQYFLFDGTYLNKVTNDLQVIKEGVDYDFNPAEESKIEVNEVTGLQPLEVLKAKIKATTKDPKQLEYELKNLEIEYNKIKTEREQIYNEGLNKAKEIALAEQGGWKQLAANGIDIDSFTKADQEILKNGPPKESDVDTEVELINNPEQVRNNLPAYRHRISATQYVALERYAKELQSDSKYIEATGNTTLLNATLTKNGMGHLWTSKNKKDKTQYVLINNAWINEINARQITKGNVKLTRGEKLAALHFVLLGDKVNVDNYWTGDDKKVNVHLVNQDRLEDVYVDIPYKGKNERVFTSKIPAKPGNDVLKQITDALRREGIPVSQKAIAEYWVELGRPMSEAEATKNALTYEEEN